MGIGNLTGIPWHVEKLHSTEEHRRHPSKCKFRDKNIKKCTCEYSPYFKHMCITAMNCEFYKEKMEAPTPKQEIFTFNQNGNAKTTSYEPLVIDVKHVKPNITCGMVLFNKKYGRGIVTKVTEKQVELSFRGEKHLFVYPSTLEEGYLTNRP